MDIPKLEREWTPEERARREAVLDRAAELCKGYKAQGFHCSESSIRACAQALDLHLSEDVIRAACGFRGGGGGYQDRCGILEAGCMLISYLYGRLAPHQEPWPYSYLIRVLHERYKANLTSIYCRDILAREEADKVEETCLRTYDIGARTVVELLLDADELLANIPEAEKYV